MKSCIITFIAGSFLASLSAPAALVITEVMSNSGHAGGAGNGDWFEIHNTGVSAINLTGWSWDDDSQIAGTHSFGGVTIVAGGFALVVDENSSLITNWAADVWGITPSPTLVLVNNSMTNGFSGLGAPGDGIYIYDSSNSLQAFVTFGTATGGTSFEWDAGGNSLGLSVVGQNGAYTAFLNGDDGGTDTNPALYSPGSDIASPGAIPEPSAALLGALGLLALMRRRR